nr:uncharacterized protein LOC124809027 [Hydra vulgaris]
MNIVSVIELNPENFNESVWQKDITKLPDITWRDVITFLIDTPSEFTKENTKAYKSLEAYKTYFLCAHVQDCLYAPSINEVYCFIKTKVLPSQRVSIKSCMYDVWICLHKDGWIKRARCTCLVGLGSVCSHIAALFFKLEAAVHHRLNREDASTSQLCLWNTSKRSVNATPLSAMNFSTNKKRGELPSFNNLVHKKKIKSIRASTMFKVNGNYSYIDPSHCISVSDFNNLRESNPKAVIFTSLDCNSNQKSSDTESGSEDETSCLPEPITSLFDPTCNNSTEFQLLKHSKQLYKDFSQTYFEKQYDQLAKVTYQQNQSSAWQVHRAGRITASICFNVFHTNKDVLSESLIQEIMQYKKEFKTKFTQYGKKMECFAKNTFCEIQLKKHNNFVFVDSGFHVMVDLPFLGATPDEIFTCSCHGKGILEIKCPFNYKNGFINWQSDEKFPLNSDGLLIKSSLFFPNAVTNVCLQSYLW